MNLTRFARAVCAVALLGTLAACTGDPEPKFADPTSDSTPETPTPTSTEATTPVPKDESATAFVIRWQSEVTITMQQSGDTAEYRALSDPRCVSCTAYADWIEKIYRRGGYANGGEGSIPSITEKVVDGKLHIINYVWRSEDTEYTNKTGGKVHRIKGGESSYQINVERHSDGWLVTRVARRVP